MRTRIAAGVVVALLAFFAGWTANSTIAALQADVSVLQADIEVLRNQLCVEAKLQDENDRAAWLDVRELRQIIDPRPPAVRPWAYAGGSWSPPRPAPRQPQRFLATCPGDE